MNAWGDSWGDAWGGAWGEDPTTSGADDGDDFIAALNRRISSSKIKKQNKVVIEMVVMAITQGLLQ